MTDKERLENIQEEQRGLRAEIDALRKTGNGVAWRQWALEKSLMYFDGMTSQEHIQVAANLLRYITTGEVPPEKMAAPQAEGEADGQS